MTKLTWSQPGGALLASDEVAHSAAGRVKNELIDGTDANAGDNFVYDGAGRLIDAWVPGHALAYRFADAGGCGPAPGAGRNTNRTSVTDNGSTSCYDAADKLSRRPTPATPPWPPTTTRTPPRWGQRPSPTTEPTATRPPPARAAPFATGATPPTASWSAR